MAAHTLAKIADMLILSLIIAAPVLVAMLGCATPDGPGPSGSQPDDSLDDDVADSRDPTESDLDRERRRRMVEEQLLRRDITNPRVLEAMARVPRQRFVPPEQRSAAYFDGPLPIGKGQTISQPYIVALMTQLADPKPDDVALDVGTGSGYQAAVLGELVKDVYSIEIVPELAATARGRLMDLGYTNVEARHGDGSQGWPERAPFDIIIAAAAAEEIPVALVDQLAPGGRLVLPIGSYPQELIKVEKHADGRLTQKRIAPVAFVPMTGDVQRPN